MLAPMPASLRCHPGECIHVRRLSGPRQFVDPQSEDSLAAPVMDKVRHMTQSAHIARAPRTQLSPKVVYNVPAAPMRISPAVVPSMNMPGTPAITLPYA